MLYLYIFLSVARFINFGFEFAFHASLLLFVVWRVPRVLVLTLLSIGFPYCAHLVGCSASIGLQFVQALMAPKPIVELHTI